MSGTAGAGGGGERALSITVSGTATDFIAVGFHAEETISAPFVLTIDFYASGAPLSPDQYLHQPLSLTVARPGGPKRYFNGMIRRLVTHGTALRGYGFYRFEVVPKLWFLSQTIDCRIFPDATVTDIFQKIFNEQSITYDSRLQGTPSQRPYTTQYNETDLAFVSRLMEEEGLYYYFEHSQSAHTLVILDYNGAFQAISDGSLAFVETGGNYDVLTAFRLCNETAWGSVTLSDYDPVTVNQPSGTSSTLLSASGTSQREVYLWPGRSDKTDILNDRAKFQSQAADAAAVLYEGEGQHEGFFAGGRFTLATDPMTGDANAPFVVQKVVHDFADPTWITGGGEIAYRNSFTAFPNATTWRQPFATPRPRMTGVYSAVVLTASGEIDSEEIGRIKVQFFWDHRQSETGSSAIWVRVIQPWSGNGWGWQHMPRKGSEVAVAFMHGDPDQPVVIGCFYNGQQKPPFPLPGQQVKSGFRSRSSAGGGGSNYSELSFDDTSGSEVVLLHAEKDLTVEVEHDQSLSVGNDRTLSVKGKVSHTSEKDYTVTSSSGNIVVNAQAGSVKVTGAQAIQLAVGEGSSVKMDSTSITLTVGENSIKIDPSGVAIKGTMVKAAAQAMLDLKGPMASLTGDGMLTLKGGLVQVN